MISYDQLIQCLAAYARSEILPHLVAAASQHPVLSALGIATPDGVDADRLLAVLRTLLSKQDAVTVPVPLLGKMTFSVHDIDTLQKYING